MPPQTSLVSNCIIFILLLCFVSCSNGSGCSFVSASITHSKTVSQYGVTFEFDNTYPVGQFMNGDYWVVGPLVLVNITPEWDGKMNGFEVNPVNYTNNGFDSRIYGFSASLVPALPLKLTGVTTVVKSISLPADTPNKGANTPYLLTAVVLTVLTSIPVNSTSKFRPPYFGMEKVILNDTQILFSKLPLVKLPTGVTDVPTLDWVVQRFMRVQLDNKNDWSGIAMHPVDNMPNYGADIADDTGDGSLRLLLSDVMTAENGTCALIQYLQYSIDLYGMLKGGNSWPANGGHGNGRKLPLVFGATFLDYPDIAATISEKVENLLIFAEDSEIYLSPKTNKVIFGTPGCSEEMYWIDVMTGGGQKDCRDPYEYVDGTGKSGTAYQLCCTSMVWKDAAVSLFIMPEFAKLWGNDIMVTYVKRWVSYGVISLPDPCAPFDGNTTNYGKTFGPNGKGGCILGSGRFPEMNGTEVDGGYYDSAFANQMYPHFAPSSSSQLLSPSF